jgi:hypothetical protein
MNLSSFEILVKNNVLIVHHHQQHLALIICWVKIWWSFHLIDKLRIFLIGVFLLVVGGIFVGFFLLTIEIIVKRHKQRLEKENEISRPALIRWKKRIKVRIIYNIGFLSKFSFQEPKQQQPPMISESRATNS